MHRLRDLDRRQRWVAAAMVVLLALPVGVSIVRAWHVGWLPSGDDALIALRTHDVFTGDRPLVGQPSTSHLYGPTDGTSHPGPIEFYALAVPFRVLGPSVGMILGVAAVNLGAVLVAVWVAYRRAGPAVGAWAAVLASLLLWAEGTAILTDPISSNLGGIPLLALGALCWAILDGDLRLLPLAALVASWVGQQHLSIVVPTSALIATIVGATVVHAAVRWRARRASMAAEPEAAPETDVEPGDDTSDRSEPATARSSASGDGAGDGAGTRSGVDRPGRSWPWVVGALGVLAVCWSPVLWQQVTGDPGNITAVVRYAQDSHTESVGAMAGLRQAVRALGAPPLLTRSDLSGWQFFARPLGPIEVAVAAAGYAVLGVTTVLAWRRRPTMARAAATALLLAAAGAYNGASIPDSVEAFRINFYRWPFVVAWLAWIVYGWLAVDAARAIARRFDWSWAPALRRVGPALAVSVMVLAAVATSVTAGADDERRDQSGFGVMRSMADAAVDAADDAGADRVTLVLRGPSAALASGPAVATQLEAAGVSVVVPEVEGRFWGDRVLAPGEDPGDLILELVTGRGGVPDGPGDTIARVDLNEDIRAEVDALSEEARSQEVVVSERGEELLRQRYEDGPRPFVRRMMSLIDTEPARVLSSDEYVDLILAGYYESPQLDPERLEGLRAKLPGTTVNDDDVFELRVLTPAELADVVPEWKEG